MCRELLTSSYEFYSPHNSLSRTFFFILTLPLMGPYLLHSVAPSEALGPAWLPSCKLSHPWRVHLPLMWHFMCSSTSHPHSLADCWNDDSARCPHAPIAIGTTMVSSRPHTPHSSVDWNDVDMMNDDWVPYTSVYLEWIRKLL